MQGPRRPLTTGRVKESGTGCGQRWPRKTAANLTPGNLLVRMPSAPLRLDLEWLPGMIKSGVKSRRAVDETSRSACAQPRAHRLLALHRPTSPH